MYLKYQFDIHSFDDYNCSRYTNFYDSTLFVCLCVSSMLVKYCYFVTDFVVNENLSARLLVGLLLLVVLLLLARSD